MRLPECSDSRSKGPESTCLLSPVFHTPVFQPPAASVSTAAQESLCLFTRNTAQCILCPPTSQELGTSPKGISPYWDKVEAHPRVLHLYPCSADLSILCRWTKFMSQVPSPIRSVKPASHLRG